MLLLKEYSYLDVIRQMAKRRKSHVFLVGGFIRDYLLGELKHDFDFAVEKNACAFALSFSKKIKGAYILLDQERGCARVAKKMKGQIFTFDFAQFRGETFDDDLAHRDFSINTLFVDMAALKFSDCLSNVIVASKTAQKDLKAQLIKMTSAKVFKEDPLRMLRAFGLRASIGFAIDCKTMARIEKDKDLLNSVSVERIRDEFFKILKVDHASRILEEMDRIGLLEVILPQIKVMFDCRQGAYHHLNVWPHSLETVKQFEKIVEENKDNFDIVADLNQVLASDRKRIALIKLACLLHDIGKPDTRKKEGNKYSFHGHERVGRNIVRSMARMLKLSTRERFALEDMVQWHLRPGYLSNFKVPSQKAIYRYFRDTKAEALSIALLALADQRSTCGPLTTVADQVHHEKICMQLVFQYLEDKKKIPFVPLINGHDLMRVLKLKPSAVIGELLSLVEEQQVLGQIVTKQQAYEFARLRYAKVKKV